MPVQRMNFYERNLRHNFLVNLLDGAGFGAALGFASFVTVIPLFVSQLTNSAILIGLIPAIHAVGWELPQLFMARRVSRLRVFRPAVLTYTLFERLPFLGLAVVAWFAPALGLQLSLVLVFSLLIIQAFSGGLTGNAWQSMIAHIMPGRLIGTFFGTQSAVANGFAAGAAVLAGLLLERQDSPLDFTLAFLLASLCMGISWFFLALTREEPRAETPGPSESIPLRGHVSQILRRDANFRGFLAVRSLSQFAAMGFAFYTVYAVHNMGMSEATIGLMTGLLMAIQILANPLMGWIGDRHSHRPILLFGVLCTIASGLLAWLAPSGGWFYLVFALAGLGNATMWTTPMAMIIQFSGELERPAYIGMANTLIAPSTFLAPILGGWLAQRSGYPATFLASAVFGVITALVLQLAVTDPRHLSALQPASPVEPES